MKRISILVVSLFSLAASMHSQPLFIEKAKIDFEVTVNNYKSFDAYFNNEDGSEDSWTERFKNESAKFTTTYYDYVFAGNKSIYTFKKLHEKNRSRWDNDADFEGDTWYHDFNTGTSAFSRNFWSTDFVFTDSIGEMKWKLVPNDNRIIAGFNCRKAYTILFDSVYVFAYYTDEITISGGPQGLHGLPGMILGVTVPRMYSSWIATNVSLTAVDETVIKSPADKKSKTRKEVLEKFMKRAEEDGRWMQRNIWNFFL